MMLSCRIEQARQVTPLKDAEDLGPFVVKSQIRVSLTAMQESELQ